MLETIVISIGCIFIIYWVAQLIFFKLHKSWSHKTIESSSPDEHTPVSFIHPIKDLDFEMEKNLMACLEQNYQGKVEHIFSFQKENDPAIPVVEKVMKKYPSIPYQIIVNPLIPGINGKSSNMVHGIRQASNSFCVFIDSDLRPKKDFLVKMIKPLHDPKVGMTTCPQINQGGNDFWTRFFTFLQNGETDFMWAFLTKLGMSVGATGAAFAMRKEVIEEVGGLEAFGDSILEDLYLGEYLDDIGYQLVLGPIVDCFVDVLPKEKAINYGKRMGVGVIQNLIYEVPLFFCMLFWYWIVLIIALSTANWILIIFSVVVFLIRMAHGLTMRIMAEGKIKMIDLPMAYLFDIFGTFCLIYGFTKPAVTWRGIVYETKAGGMIDKMKERK